MDIEPFLQPISPENPCGEDLSYDTAFNDLETQARGKEAQQFSGSDNPEWSVAAEEPDWKAITDSACELFTRSKDLRVALILTLALLRQEQLYGLRDGLYLLLRLIREQWEGVYPRLDPDDNNDPLERMNIIAGLAKPLATFGDPMRFIERVRQAPLTNSVRMGRFSLADITQIGQPGGATEGAPSREQIEAAFRDTNQDELAGISQAANDARAAISELDALLIELVGVGSVPNLDELSNTLKEIQQTLKPYLPAGAVPDLGSSDGAGDAGASSSMMDMGSGQSFTGEIRSRQDVSRALDQICAYYNVAEPGHPLPLLLKRAQRLVDKDFMAIMEDLVPEALAQIMALTGQRGGGGEAPAETPSE